MSRAKLTELRSEQQLGPWKGRVTINAMTGHQLGRQTSLPHDTLYQVTAEWTGPSPVYSANPDATDVQAQDTVITTTYIGALRTAKIAADQLRNAQVPDLRKLAEADSASAPK